MNPSTFRCSAYDIPLALDNNLSSERGLDPRGAPSRNKIHAQESRHWTVAPMPLMEFMNDFLPMSEVPSCESLSTQDALSSVPLRADTPAELYQPLLAALDKKTEGESICPGFVFDAAARRSPHPHQLGYMKPHICLYRSENLETVLKSDPLSRKELAYAELIIEVTGDPTQDFFIDPETAEDATEEEHTSHELTTSSNDPRFREFVDRTLGQHISYIMEILARQCRVCFFSIALFGSRARLFRWDRSGCIVTESFDVRAQPELLCDFLWRFARSSDAGRGHDPTVHMASTKEEELFRQSIREHVRMQLDVDGDELEKAVSEHYEPSHVFVLYVLQQGANVANTKTVRHYLVSRPVVSPLFLAGKGTRGFWAVDTLSQRVVFLKDTWRNYGRSVEGDTLARMNEEGIRNIPSLVWHGNVPDFLSDGEPVQKDNFQMTMNDEYCRDQWRANIHGYKHSLRKHVHYRIVLGVVGYGLEHLKDTEELLHATYNVFQAMVDARQKDSRLHQDISTDNIILVREPGCSGPRKGYLIDWDVSCEADPSGTSYEAGRVGTWQFMSIATLGSSGRTRKHTFLDDMESLIYVVLYCGFLWLPHRLSREKLTTIMQQVFDDRLMDDNDLPYTGGIGKWDIRCYRHYPDAAGFDPAFKEWIDSMTEIYWPLADTSKRGPIDWTILGVPISQSWTAENVESFWTKFLNTHTLPRNDRVIHNNPRSTGDYYAGVAVISCPSYGCGSPRLTIPNPEPQATPASTSPAPAEANTASPLNSMLTVTPLPSEHRQGSPPREKTIPTKRKATSEDNVVSKHPRITSPSPGKRSRTALPNEIGELNSCFALESTRMPLYVAPLLFR
ncbi:hypothetical protein C8Q74DRAFT_1422593 [Fomes fomentarius]|nr:hypothetical protein C8Q74DRAFT_1422593 [Fomes fomentarius]